jgi:SAM-dependent methyltransferase
MDRQDKIKCRLCGSMAGYLGTLRPYIDYSTPIFACDGCGARLVVHDSSVHERLHASAKSSYAWHKDLAAAAAGYFSRNDRLGLRSLLDTAPKNRLVMNELDRLPVGSKVLEVGCSRGYLTAYALLCGHQVLGVDVSPDAIAEATQLFGNHFVLLQDPRISAGVPYDLIYHVGTIGCVEDPVGLIRTELAQLRQGGLLVFNAPDVAAAVERHRLWSVATTPPDLVTLFDRGWFMSAFSELAVVDVELAHEDPLVSLRRTLGRDGVLSENMPRFRLFEDAPEQRVYAVEPASTSMARNAIKGVLRLLHSMRLIPRHAHEYGILVRMIKR